MGHPCINAEAASEQPVIQLRTKVQYNIRDLSRRLTIKLVATCLPMALVASNVCAQQEMPHLKIAAINIFVFSPVFVAKELGYYKAEGLDVDILETNSGNSSTSALLGGSVAAATTGFSEPLLLADQGKVVKHLVGMDMSSIYVFVAGPTISVANDNPAALAAALKSKRIGVASLGSTGNVIAEGVLSQYGLTNKDVIYVAVGTGATALAAFKAGAVDAIITYEPDLTKIIESGAGKVVLDLRSTKNEKNYSQLPTSTLQATGDWLDKNPELAAKLARAISRADKTLREDPVTSLAVLGKLYPTMSKASLKAMYEASHLDFRPKIPEEQYKRALGLYLAAHLVKSPVPFENVVATQYQKYWDGP